MCVCVLSVYLRFAFQRMCALVTFHKIWADLNSVLRFFFVFCNNKFKMENLNSIKFSESGFEMMIRDDNIKFYVPSFNVLDALVFLPLVLHLNTNGEQILNKIDLTQHDVCVDIQKLKYKVFICKADTKSQDK